MPKLLAKSYAAFRNKVEERGRELRALSYDQLRRLGESSERLTVESRPARISVIIRPQPDESLQIVVQGLIKVRFVPMVSQAALDGFYKHADETISAISRRDMYEFD